MLPSPRPMVPALLPTVLGLALVGVSLAALRRLARAPTGAFRSGPWPGLTPRGAVLLLVYALLLAGSQLAVGQAELDTARRSALWYVPAIAVGAIAAPVLAARMTGMPGAASAVCGAYLLPRSLASLAFPVLATPPLLLAPAMALDVALWLRPSDLAWLFAAWPRGPAARAKRAWRPRESGPRRCARRDAARHPRAGRRTAARSGPVPVDDRGHHRGGVARYPRRCHRRVDVRALTRARLAPKAPRALLTRILARWRGAPPARRGQPRAPA